MCVCVQSTSDSIMPSSCKRLWMPLLFVEVDIYSVLATERGNKVATFQLLHAQGAQNNLVFQNIVQKLWNATFPMPFCSKTAPLSHGVAPPSDRPNRGFSLMNGPVWKFALLKGDQKYLLRMGWLLSMEGLPWRQLSIWTSFKTSLAKVFPVDCELCFFSCGPI